MKKIQTFNKRNLQSKNAMDKALHRVAKNMVLLYQLGIAPSQVMRLTLNLS